MQCEWRGGGQGKGDRVGGKGVWIGAAGGCSRCSCDGGWCRGGDGLAEVLVPPVRRGWKKGGCRWQGESGSLEPSGIT